MASEAVVAPAPTLIGRLFTRFNEGLVWPLATLLLLFTGGVMLMEAGDRTFFNHSYIWSEETIRYSLLWAAFLCFGLAGAHHRHLRSDLLLRVMPKPLQKVCMKIGDLAGLLFCMLLITGAWVQLQQLLANGMTTEALFDIPVWVIFLIIPIAVSIFAMYYLLSLVGALAETVPEVSDLPLVD